MAAEQSSRRAIGQRGLVKISFDPRRTPRKSRAQLGRQLLVEPVQRTPKADDPRSRIIGGAEDNHETTTRRGRHDVGL